MNNRSYFFQKREKNISVSGQVWCFIKYHNFPEHKNCKVIFLQIVKHVIKSGLFQELFNNLNIKYILINIAGRFSINFTNNLQIYKFELFITQGLIFRNTHSPSAKSFIPTWTLFLTFFYKFCMIYYGLTTN